mmetsp:Transcript_42109/g.131028  ORF Transcript_42109/g.131028 Transcript_42109/m.131028 type:complete len:232 (-) Transcript_42109:120-815(-)
MQVPHRLQELPHVPQHRVLEELAALLVAEPLHAVQQVPAVAILQQQPRGLVVAEGAQHPEQVPALLGLPAQEGIDPDLVERILLRAGAAAEGGLVVGLPHAAAVDELAGHDLRDRDLVRAAGAGPHVALHLAEEALPLPPLHPREGARIQLLEGGEAVEVVEVCRAVVDGRGRRGRERRRRLQSRGGVRLPGRPRRLLLLWLDRHPRRSAGARRPGCRRIGPGRSRDRSRR